MATKHAENKQAHIRPRLCFPTHNCIYLMSNHSSYFPSGLEPSLTAHQSPVLLTVPSTEKKTHFYTGEVALRRHNQKYDR